MPPTERKKNNMVRPSRKPCPFGKPYPSWKGKKPSASAMTTAEWRRMPVAVRLKSQFSATLTSVKAAKAITDYLTGYVRGDKAVNDLGQEYQVYQGRAEIRGPNEGHHDRRRASAKFFMTGRWTLGNSLTTTLRDLRGCRRLQRIFLTPSAEQAASYAQWQEGQDPDILDIVPVEISSASVRFTRRAPTMMPLLAPSAAGDDLAFSGFPQSGFSSSMGALGLQLRLRCGGRGPRRGRGGRRHQADRQGPANRQRLFGRSERIHPWPG